MAHDFSDSTGPAPLLQPDLELPASALGCFLFLICMVRIHTWEMEGRTLGTNVGAQSEEKLEMLPWDIL